jgi:hypothetical protein
MPHSSAPVRAIGDVGQVPAPDGSGYAAVGHLIE